MSDLIDRQAVIDAVGDWIYNPEDLRYHKDVINSIPAVQPDHVADISKKVERTDETAQNVQNEDLISRKWLVECIEEGWVKFDTAKDCNRMMHLVRDIAPSVQPEQNAQDEDLISRKAAIEALARMMPRSYTPDGSHPADEEIFRAQEVFVDCIEALEILPSAQPEILACGEGELNVPDTNVGDMISRQAAIDALKDWHDGMIISSFRGIEKVIKALPPAQPEERKKGAWILGFDNQYLEKYYFCSKCGSRKYMEDKPLDNFCANCGADMRGEQDGRDD